MITQYGFAMKCFVAKQRIAAWKSTILALATVLALLIALDDVDAHSALQTDRRLSAAIDRALQEGVFGCGLGCRRKLEDSRQAIWSVRGPWPRSDSSISPCYFKSDFYDRAKSSASRSFEDAGYVSI